MLFLSTLWWLPVVHAAVLTNFQVTQPVLVPTGVKECTVQVLRRDFAFSYGISEVVELEPPTDCGPVGSWSAITLNFTVTSNGTQYDRLGIFTFQNVEIWRTSTPEPTRGDGIIWTYIKDVTQYIPLFETTGTFILQLDNIIQEGLDGVYSTVLSATYYEATDLYPPAPRADHIITLSTMRNDTGNDASVPPGFSINVTLPVNSIKIYAELFASGNSQEEFWYYNVPNEFIPALPENTAYPQGPFREVRLLIDGQLAGIAFPYAVLFTGGIIPSFWRPISAYGALDLPTYFIDVTPFAPLLTDGLPHEFVIDVSSAESDHVINQNWYISGLLQIITDTSPEPTTGGITAYDVEPFAISTSSGETLNGGDDVEITVKSTRQIHIESTVISGSGEVTNVVWSQQLSYSNVQTYLNNALTQLARQTSEGIIVSTHNGEPVVADTFSYPLDIDIQYENMEATSWTASLNHTYDRTVQPNPLVLGTTIHNDQRVDGFFQRRTGGNIGNGSSSNVFSYIDTVGNTYARKVNAALNVITLDEESGSMANKMAKESLQRLQVVGLSEGDDSSEVRLPGQSL